MTELVLGTAQLGAAYGITNEVGRLTDDTVREIMDAAVEGGIHVFDTSPAYGDAQRRLGALAPSSPPPEYVSKFALEGEPTEDLLYGGTLAQLGVGHLHGVMFHRVGDLRSEYATRAWDILRRARAEGIVARIGASVYDADDLEAAMAVLPGLDILQIPGSVVDRRLLDHPGVRRLHAEGAQIHVRSAYLQGLLLLAPERIPEHLGRLRPAVADLRARAARLGLGVPALVLGYLKYHPSVDAVVVGALSAVELRDTTRAWAAARGDDIPDYRVPREVVDPRTWPRRGVA